jgi:hypothetical protein
MAGNFLVLTLYVVDTSHVRLLYFTSQKIALSQIISGMVVYKRSKPTRYLVIKIRCQVTAYMLQT